MNKKNRTRAKAKASRDYGLIETGPCMEAIQTVKARYKKTKEHFKMIVKLAEQDAIHYDYKDEIVGKAYMTMRYAKQELQRRKAMK